MFYHGLVHHVDIYENINNVFPVYNYNNNNENRGKNKHPGRKEQFNNKDTCQMGKGRWNKRKWEVEKWAGHRQWVSEMKISRGRKYK